MQNKLKTAPFLPTSIQTSKNILYHGGYTKSLYTSWNNLLESSRKKLSQSLRKYSTCSQKVYSWYSNF
jgi:hypothetical protein